MFFCLLGGGVCSELIPGTILGTIQVSHTNKARTLTCTAIYALYLDNSQTTDCGNKIQAGQRKLTIGNIFFPIQQNYKMKHSLRISAEQNLYLIMKTDDRTVDAHIKSIDSYHQWYQLIVILNKYKGRIKVRIIIHGEGRSRLKMDGMK